MRSVNFGTVTIKESLPQEVKYLKYLETFQVYGNANTMLLNIALENHICELKHLKNLQIGGYGLVSLPEDFKKLPNIGITGFECQQLYRCTGCIDQRKLPCTEKVDAER